MEILFKQHFELIYFEKFEYSLFRKFLRSSHAFLFGIVGLITRFFMSKYWADTKLNKTNKVQEIGLYVFKKI